MGKRRAFVTGSHAYGKPTSKSDIDLVVFISQEDMEKIINEANSNQRTDYGGPILCFGVRFGKLNLLMMADERRFNVWKKGTRLLKKRKIRKGKPITRNEAIEVFQKLRKESGIV